MNISAVILAGGKSSRMGQDKALLEIGGQSLLARQIALVRDVGAREVFISGREGVDYSKFACRILVDNSPDAGPLAGILRALEVTTTPLLLVLAVDMPEMSVEFLRRLAAYCSETTGAIPRIGGHIEPLAAFYPNRLKLELKQAGPETGAPGAKSFAEECVRAELARFVDLPLSDAWYFTNWNSPADILRSPLSVL